MRHIFIKSKEKPNKLHLTMKYYIQYQGQTVGPMTPAEMANYQLTANTMVCPEGGDAWKPLFSFPELMPMVAKQNAPAGYIDEEVHNKKILCGVLAILVGTLGVQYFVLGKTSGGIYTILLSFFSCGLWSIITFIQGILMLCMTDAEFERKYIQTPASFPIF